MEEADHGATANDESTVTPIQAAAQVESKPDETTSIKVSESASDTADKNRERQDRFKALQARAVSRWNGHQSTPGYPFPTSSRTNSNEPIH